MKKFTFNVYPSALAMSMWMLLLGAFAFTAPRPAAAQDMADHFKGKTINIIVGSAAGGGYDIMARLIGRFGPKHFPGSPRFIVTNMPGGGGMRALQHTIREKPDGLTALTITLALVQQAFLGIDVPGLDVGAIRWIGAPTYVVDDYIICADRKVVKSWEEMLKAPRPLTMAAETPGSRSYLGAHLVQLAGGPIRMIWGYKTTPEQLAAFDRGETQVSSCHERRDPRLFPELLKQKRWVPLFWWNDRPRQEYLEQLGPPAPYQIFELPGMRFTDAQKRAFETSVDIFQYLRMYILPPGVPDNVYKTWKQAFAATIKDPEFIKAATDGGYEVGLGDPDKFLKLADTVRALPPDGKEVLRALIGQK